MGRIYKKGASEIDQCAHRLYDLQQNRNKDIRWDKTAVTCWACGEKLETYSHEERLYSVRCSHCKIETAADDNVPVMLIKAGNPDKAAEIYNNRDKLAFRTKNNRRASVLANALRFSDDLYESGVCDYISCQGYGEVDCGYDGSNDHTPCMECKAEWLEGEWDE